MQLFRYTEYKMKLVTSSTASKLIIVDTDAQ